jgi:tRNA-Thr(GGU) m(6)t(6)A37 methyltransferase TsaA
MMKQITYKPIGIIHSPFFKIEDMPIQSSSAEGIRGQIVLNEKYIEGICDLDGFSHIYLLYHFHLSKSFNLKVVPFLDNQERGVFSTRAPKRPNSIGLSVVKLIKIDKNILEIENVDIVDGTPLLDIKPYIQEMEGVEQFRIGWLSKYKDEIKIKNSDKRFE